jgi:hypothetical protein
MTQITSQPTPESPSVPSVESPVSLGTGGREPAALGTGGREPAALGTGGREPAPKFHTYLLLALSATLCLIAFLLEGHVGFDLADEGFLWYGVQQVMHGNVPIRDFFAYDIGRYYWCAFFGSIFHNDGIMCLRAAAAALAAVAICLATMLVDERTRKRSFLVCIAVSVFLIAWMVPRHKVFDISSSLLILFSLTRVMQSQTPRAFFVNGLVIGLAAVIGRNHGVYGVVGFVGIAALLWRQGLTLNWRALLPTWICGVAVGYSPVLLASVLIPGFFNSFVFALLFNLKEYNPLPLPVPWPWISAFSHPFVFQDVAVGCMYAFLVLFNAIGALYLLYAAARRRPVDPLLASCVLLSLGYTHHAFSRAGIGHLAQGIFPMLIGVLALQTMGSLAKPLRLALLATVVVASLAAVLPYHPKIASIGNHWVTVDIGQDRLRIHPAMAYVINSIRPLIHNYAPDGRVVATPLWPGLYPMLSVKSPLFDIYGLFKRRADFQRQEIARLAAYNPSLIIVQDNAIDGRDQQRFSRTHEIENDYIRQNYSELSCNIMPDLRVYIARSRTVQGGGE